MSGMRWTAVAVLVGCLAPLCTAPVAHAVTAPAIPAAPAAPANCNPPAGVMTKRQLDQNGQPWAQRILNIGAAHERATGRGSRSRWWTAASPRRTPNSPGRS